MNGAGNGFEPSPPVRWQEGMLLMPQHFQLQDRQLMQYAFALFQLYGADHWGIVELKFNDAALGQGVVELSAFRALFPDGTLVSLGGNSVIDSRYLLDRLDGDADLFVALRRWPESGAAPEDKHDGDDDGCGVPARFVAATLAVTGLDEERQRIDLGVLNYRLRLVLAGEPEATHGHDLIRIARVRRDGDTLALAPDHIPPLLAADASGALGTFITNLLSWLERRRRELALRQEQDPDPIQESLRQWLCRCIGQWRGWLSTAPLPPRQMFNAMLAAAGEAACLRTRGGAAAPWRVDDEPVYEHRDITASLARAAERLRAVLEDNGRQGLRELGFQRDDDYFQLSLNEDWLATLQRAHQALIVFSAGPGTPLSATSLRGQCKLASRDTLSGLVARSLPGIALSAAPAALGGQDEVVLELQRHGEYWDEVRIDGNLAMYVEGAPPGLRARLLLIGAGDRS